MIGKVRAYAAYWDRSYDTDLLHTARSPMCPPPRKYLGSTSTLKSGHRNPHFFRINDSREAFNDAVIDQGIDPGLRGHAGQPNLLSQIRVRDSSVLAEDRDDFAVRIINQEVRSHRKNEYPWAVAPLVLLICKSYLTKLLQNVIKMKFILAIRLNI